MLESERVVRDFFDRLNTGDMEQIRPLVRNATWRPMVKGMTSAEAYSGDDIVDTFLVPVRGIFKAGDPKVSIDLLVADERTVAAETKGYGELGDGRAYDNRYAWFFQVEGASIIEIHEYLDSNYVAGLARPEPTE